MASSLVQSCTFVPVLLCFVLITCGAHVARLSVPCVDSPSLDCADLDNMAHICTKFPDSEETKTFCPKYCGLCGNDAGTTSGTMRSKTPSPQTQRSETTTPKQVKTTTSTIVNTTPAPLGHSTSIIPTQTPSHSEATTPKQVTATTSATFVTTTPKPSLTSTTTSKQFHVTTPGRMSTLMSSHADKTNNHQSTLDPSESTTTPSLQTALSLTFHAQDRNHDGVITYLEFEELWKLVDLNGDDRVTLDEYAASTHFSKYFSSEVYQFIDHDHNDVITIQEVPRIFLEFDSNYDGKIEENEYIVEYTRVTSNMI